MNSTGQRRRFLVCCDGSGERPTGNVSNDSNPYRMAQLAADGDGDIEQVVGYQQGVGTLEHDDRHELNSLKNDWALGLGDGLDYNSFKVCQWLVQNGCVQYDEIILCGFSRGAFTQRIVAQYINDVGLIPRGSDEEDDEYTQRAWVTFYQWFLDKAQHSLSPDELQRAHESLSRAEEAIPHQHYDPPFRPQSVSLALFDTVATTGLPGNLGHLVSDIANKISSLAAKWEWLKEDLPSVVTWGRHALSRGEHRKLFAALLMRGEIDLAQRWFPGAHVAVGGGSKNQENNIASLDPLLFMVGELHDSGKFLFDTEKLQRIVPLIANQDSVHQVTSLPTSTTGFYEHLGIASRKPGTVRGTTNEEVQTTPTWFQHAMSQAGEALDVPCPPNVQPVGNSQWHAYLLSLAEQPPDYERQPEQLPDIPEESWVPSASTEEDVAEYKHLTGIDDSDDLSAANSGGSDPERSLHEGFDAGGHDAGYDGRHDGQHGGGHDGGPKFPHPGGHLGSIKSWLHHTI